MANHTIRECVHGGVTETCDECERAQTKTIASLRAALAAAEKERDKFKALWTGAQNVAEQMSDRAAAAEKRAGEAEAEIVRLRDLHLERTRTSGRWLRDLRVAESRISALEKGLGEAIGELEKRVATGPWLDRFRSLLWGEEKPKCGTCGGTGRIRGCLRSASGLHEVDDPCPACAAED